MKKMPRWLAVFAALLLPFAAVAQQKGLDIDIIGGNASALPITIVPMPYQGSSAAPQTDVAGVVRAEHPAMYFCLLVHALHPPPGSPVLMQLIAPQVGGDAFAPALIHQVEMLFFAPPATPPCGVLLGNLRDHSDSKKG